MIRIALSLSPMSDLYGRPDVQRLLSHASELVNGDPACITHHRDGTMSIHCPLPHGYKTRLNPYATELWGRFSPNGRFFELGEMRRKSGGYIGPDLPDRMVIAFLKGWISYASKPRQGDLFQEASNDSGRAREAA